MRTTITIDDDLLAEAKVRAAKSRRTLGAVIDDALRASFLERPAQRAPFVLHTKGHGGFQPGVDLNDKEALAEILGDPDYRPHASS